MKNLFIILIALNLNFASIFANNYGLSDKGIGVAFIKSSIPKNSENNGSILLFDSTFSKIICNFKFDSKDTVERFQIISNEIVKNDLFEFDYETLGLPIAKKYNGKLKVIIGEDKLGKIKTAWIKLSEKSLGYYLWETYLPKKELYFLNSKSMYLFYDIPNGKRIDFNLIKDKSKYSQYKEKEFEFNYIMHPIENKGIWLKVNVVTPSDYCEEVIKPKRKFYG